MNTGSNTRSWRPGLTLLLLACGMTSSLQAAALDVGTWSGSSTGRRWGDVGFSNISATLNLTAGATYNSNANVSSITGFTHFVIAEAKQYMSGGDLTALKTWIQGGGILLLFVDTSLVNAGTGTNNLFYSQSILTGIGSSIQVDLSGTSICQIGGGGSCPAGVNTSLATGLTSSTPGSFAVNNGAGIGGEGLAATFASIRVSGGNSVANAGSNLSNLLRTESIGLGTVFVFGDRFDHNYVLGGADGVAGCNLMIAACAINQTLFANIFMGPDGGGPISGIPEPSSVFLMTGGLAGLIVFARRARAS